ncbi:Hypothetical predicted protein [Cloeon dipterum]|uniref:C-type lectin domain-containing protein n=1 Tax=Cloeon dipterum TaxID=197152 RepID=A0A8S1CT07_9INSE|nr:Hypothetical predicted protein [Cloeon dipterum]
MKVVGSKHNGTLMTILVDTYYAICAIAFLLLAQADATEVFKIKGLGNVQIKKGYFGGATTLLITKIRRKHIIKCCGKNTCYSKTLNKTHQARSTSVLYTPVSSTKETKKETTLSNLATTDGLEQYYTSFVELTEQSTSSIRIPSTKTMLTATAPPTEASSKSSMSTSVAYSATKTNFDLLTTSEITSRSPTTIKLTISITEKGSPPDKLIQQPTTIEELQSWPPTTPTSFLETFSATNTSETSTSMTTTTQPPTTVEISSSSSTKIASATTMLVARSSPTAGSSKTSMSSSVAYSATYSITTSTTIKSTVQPLSTITPSPFAAPFKVGNCTLSKCPQESNCTINPQLVAPNGTFYPVPTSVGRYAQACKTTLFVSRFMLTNFEARDYCCSLGMVLMSLHDMTKKDCFLNYYTQANFSPVDYFFVDGVDTSCSDKIGWCHAKILTDWKTAPWCDQEPNYFNGTDNCIGLKVKRNSLWPPVLAASCILDENCFYQRYFICEIP